MEFTKLNDGDPRSGYCESENLFYFYEEILEIMLKGGELPIQNVYTLGSRLSGKTHAALYLIMRAFLACPFETVSYIVRKKEKQLSKMKEQMFKDYKDDYNFIVESGKNYRGPPHNEMKFKKNRTYFETLNDEKVDPSEGGVVGGATFKTAKYILIFVEECNQINRKLLDQLLDTIRGGKETQYLVIYASNPWKSMHWYVKMFQTYLPENEYEMKTKGYQMKICLDDSKAKSIFIRNNVLTNRYVPLSKIYKLQSYKSHSLNSWRICFLGLCGMSENTLYGTCYEKSKSIDWTYIKDRNLGRLHVGIDWGEGKSRNASPTTMHIGRVSFDFGAHIFGEYTLWNNGDGDRIEGKHFSTIEQFDSMIKWIMDYWLEYQEPITCFIDTGALIDFHQQLNDRAQQVWGINRSQIQFLPADKSIPIQERVLTTNVLFSKGLLRIDKEKCQNLHRCLLECTQIESENPREETKFERDHQLSHWINSGVEYILDNYQYSLSKGFSEIYETRQEEIF